MENAVLISDKLFIFASAFFRVDNTEWVNSHELIYEDDEDEIVNRISTTMEKYFHRFENFCMSIIEVILSIYEEKIMKYTLKIQKSNILEKQINTLKLSYSGRIEGSEKRLKNYNGFYSGSRGGSDNKPQKNDDLLTKIHDFLVFLFKQTQPIIKENNNKSNRMYRGKSLD